jgi:glycosyltransferase involved in cell wall biosynthesis
MNRKLKIKILFIIDRLGVGGKERRLLELLKGLKRWQNISYRLVVLSDIVFYDTTEELDCEIDYLKRKIGKDPTIFIKLYRICKNYNPDIIHSCEAMCSVYITPIAKILRIKILNAMISDAPLKVDIFDKVYLRSKLTFRFSDYIISNSNAGLKSYKVPLNKGICIHNGFNFERIANLPEFEAIKQKMGVFEKKIVGMVARFGDDKDYNTFILAAQAILRKRDDVRFLAIGNGKNLAKYIEMVHSEFKDKIRFMGNQKNIESIVNIFDIGILSSFTEGISNSIMEYMALGKPVIATYNDGNREIVENNVTGFLIEQKNVLKMAEKIEILLNDEEKAKKMGSAGKERILRHFNIKKMIDSYAKLYKKCLLDSI